jgi:hypothetical protein
MRRACYVFTFAWALALAGCRDSDATIQRHVEERLAADPEGSGLTVSVDNRVVRLTGVVDSEAEKTRLDNAVRHVGGVLAVQNELVIAAPVRTTSAPSDVQRALAASIPAQLAAAGYDALRVADTDDTVRVRGAVRAAERDDALEIARKTAPGFRVEDEIIAR